MHNSMYFSQSEYTQVISTQIKIQKLHYGRNNLKLNHPSKKSRDTWITGKFDLGVQNEAEQRLTEFCQDNTLVMAKPSSNNTTDDSTHGHHQMVNTENRLIIFFATEDREALYSQQKQDQELTGAQIMNSLL